MNRRRRDFLRCAALAGSIKLGQVYSKAATAKVGMPGPFPGRVVAVEHPGCIVSGVYQDGPIRSMMEKGMTALTGAPDGPMPGELCLRRAMLLALRSAPSAVQRFPQMPESFVRSSMASTAPECQLVM